jgi:hypothetical protein
VRLLLFWLFLLIKLSTICRPQSAITVVITVGTRAPYITHAIYPWLLQEEVIAG